MEGGDLVGLELELGSELLFEHIQRGDSLAEHHHAVVALGLGHAHLP